MIAYLAGAGSGSGAILLAWLVVELVRRRHTPTADLTDEDRESIAASFEVHTQAVKQQVSTYADELADGDPVLRERLRQFETGAC